MLDHREDEVDLDLLAVLAAGGEPEGLTGEPQIFAAREAGEAAPVGRDQALRYEDRQGSPDEVVCRPPEQSAGGLVGEDDVAADVGGEDRLVEGIEEPELGEAVG